MSGASVSARKTATARSASATKELTRVWSSESMFRRENPTAPGACRRMASRNAFATSASSSGHKSRMRTSCAGASAPAT